MSQHELAGRESNPLCAGCTVAINTYVQSAKKCEGNSSELRGAEKVATGEERIEPPSAPGTEKRCQGHGGLGSSGGAGTATDLALNHQVAEAPRGRIVVRWHRWVAHEGEEFPQEACDAPAELALHGQWVL